MDHLQIGQAGERIAHQFCIRQHWHILHSNWRSGRGEIDIIAKDNSTTVFIEVKTRTSDTFGMPEEAITPAKIAILRSTIAQYCSRYSISDMRVDVLSITIEGAKAHVRHIKDVELLPNDGAYARMPSGRLHR